MTPSMDDYLRRYPPPEQPDVAREKDAPGRDHIAPARLPVEATLDLHGFTVQDGRDALDRFIHDAVKSGRKKVLIVHGKGQTLTAPSPLRSMVQSYLEMNPCVGATGNPGIKDGGRGATWAVIRQRSR